MIAKSRINHQVYHRHHHKLSVVVPTCSILTAVLPSLYVEVLHLIYFQHLLKPQIAGKPGVAIYGVLPFLAVSGALVGFREA